MAVMTFEILAIVNQLKGRKVAHTVIMPLKLYPYCLVLVGSRNGFERDFTI